MATGAAEKQLGTPVVMESSGATLTNGSFASCADATFATAEVDGSAFALFEFDPVATYSAAPTAGAVINVYEQAFDAAGQQSLVPSATYRHKYIGHFVIAPSDDANPPPAIECPINFWGGDYSLEWVDGGAGTASVTATWTLTVTPFKYGPQA